MFILAFIGCAPQPEAVDEVLGPEAAEEPTELFFAGYRADLKRTGIFESEPLRSLSGVKWQVEIGAITTSSPVIYENILYIGTASTQHENFLYALDIETGEKIWDFKIEDRFGASAAVEGGTVYIGDSGGNFYALDSKNGDLIWDFKIEEGILSTAAVYGGEVYFGGGDLDADRDTKNGYIFALDAASGQKKWRFMDEEIGIEHLYTIETTPAISDDTLYYRTGRNMLIALDINTAEKKWSARIGGVSLPAGLPPSPAVYSEKVFCGSMDRSFYAVEPKSGEIIWAFDTGDYVHSSPAFYEDMAYIGGWSETMFALDINQGTEGWSFNIEGSWIKSPPSVAGGVLYFGADDGNLYALDAVTGKELWKFETGRGIDCSPAVAGRVVYVGSRDGYIYALH